MLPLGAGAAAGATSSGISTSPPVRNARPSGASSLGVGALRMASKSSRPASPVQVPGSGRYARRGSEDLLVKQPSSAVAVHSRHCRLAMTYWVTTAWSRRKKGRAAMSPPHRRTLDTRHPRRSHCFAAKGCLCSSCRSRPAKAAWGYSNRPPAEEKGPCSSHLHRHCNSHEPGS